MSKGNTKFQNNCASISLQFKIKRFQHKIFYLLVNNFFLESTRVFLNVVSCVYEKSRTFKIKKRIYFIIMLAKLQQTFPNIAEEVVVKACKKCNGNADKIKDVLTWLTKNTINLQQQQYLMNLFQSFGTQLEKTTISQIWKNCNQIYSDAHEKLREICATSDLNELKEENEIKISREMCLHILWNILKYPKHIKYRQINEQALYNYLFQKCHTLGADLEKIFADIKIWLQVIEFKKRNDDNWYYQYDHIQLLHLWKCYQSAIKLQKMYFCVLVLLLIKQMI
ncbi:hypothetical protein RFI_34885 [Reticulomyxa filosa]|uniref:Uncharacterized protein n=1 Tax=Reticulomyxa filosa TaxID=46433 RepID=X6LKS2_RETFI|nr:hypothetical protein RFI_34885 [Reticulomyxa filosa]|eukprot:ETO02543.1 hypothetical protein RFI_34885 [Reticulomyxa filosa]